MNPFGVLCSLRHCFPTKVSQNVVRGPARSRGIIHKNLEIPPKFPNIGGIFFPTLGSGVVISVCYLLPLCFVLAISYSVLYLVLFRPCSFRTVNRAAWPVAKGRLPANNFFWFLNIDEGVA